MKRFKLVKTLVLGMLLAFSTNTLWSQSANALKFDGVDDYVNFNDTTSGKLGTADFTIEFLVKLQEAPTQTTYVLSKRETCATGAFWEFKIEPNGNFAFVISSGSSEYYLEVPLGSLYPNCDWNHFAIVRNGTTITIYFNGIFVLSQSGVGPLNPNNTANLLIGKSPCSNTFAGMMDNLRIWDIARSQSEIQNSMTSEMVGAETNLVLNCNFNHGVANSNNPTVTILDDSSPNNQNGTLNNFALSGINSNWVDPLTSMTSTDVHTTCGPFTWIDGNTYTSSNNSASFVVTNSLGCDMTTYLDLTVIDLQDQTVTVTDPTIYCPSSTTINLQNSELEVQYVLLDNLQDTIVSGPTVGTGGPLSFNTGTITSAMDYAIEAKYGYSTGGIAFNGGSEKIVVPANPDFDFATGTLETWIRSTSALGFPEVFLSMRSDVSSSRYSFHIHNTSNLIGLWNGTTWSSVSYPINTGTWYHIALRILPTATELYIDGAYIGDLDAIGSATGESFVIGSSNDPGYTEERLHGEMDNVRVWNTLRTPAEINQNMDMCLTGSELGLVALYKLDDGTGSSVALDATGIHNGTLDPAMDPATDWVTGVGCYTCSSQLATTATVVFNQINTTGTDVQVACESFSWIDGNTYTASNNTATHLLTNSFGCDSLVTLDLTINNVTTLTTTTTGLTISADASSATYQWIDCSNGNLAITGETNQSFTATANGDYAVIVTMNGCSDTSACESITTVGLDDLLDGSTIRISPNPSKDIFVIESDLLQTASMARVISTEGKLVYKSANLVGETLHLNASNWEPGVYFLILETAKGQVTTKLMKN